jgi:uncharacterized membrane protein
MPDLHFDSAVQSMLSIAMLLIDAAPEKALAWTRTAYWCHQCIINGGTSVFLDRWGSQGKAEGQYGRALATLLESNS